MNFSDFKIRTKLGAAFFVMALLTAVTGGFAVSQLARINANTDDMATNWLPSSRYVGEMQGLLGDVRQGELLHVIGVNPEDKKPEADRIAADKAKLAEVGRKFETHLKSPAEKQAWDTYNKNLAAYYASNTKLLTMSDLGPAEAAASFDFLRGESRLAFRSLFKAMEEMYALNGQGVKDAYGGAQQTYTASQVGVLVMLGLAVALAVVMGIWITRQITGPIESAVEAAKEFADGNLTSELQAKGTDEPAQLLHALEAMRLGLAKVVANVRQGSESVATASAEIAQGNHDLSARTEQQASALEQTAASMEELSSTVKQNADSARQASQLATNASTVAVRGGEVVGQVVETMKGINESSRKINDIISVIDGIAFQTNILALNAAVEAARAGVQGRGFAVVATEVRNLAGRSADAAKEIKQLILDSAQKIETGTRLTHTARSTMDEAVDTSRQVSAHIADIHRAVEEQSSGIVQINAALNHIEDLTQKNNALVHALADSSAALDIQSHAVADSMRVIRLTQADVVVDPDAVALRRKMKEKQALPVQGAARLAATDAGRAVSRRSPQIARVTSLKVM